LRKLEDEYLQWPGSPDRSQILQQSASNASNEIDKLVIGIKSDSTDVEAIGVVDLVDSARDELGVGNADFNPDEVDEVQLGGTDSNLVVMKSMSSTQHISTMLMQM